MLGSTMARLQADAIRDRLNGGEPLERIARALGIGFETLKARMAQFDLRRPPGMHRVSPPPPEPSAPARGRPFCRTFHRWRLIYRHEAPEGIRRIWHCHDCPAERRDGPG